MRRLLAIAIVLCATNAAADTIWQKAQKPAPAGVKLTADEVHRQVARVLADPERVPIIHPTSGASSLVQLEGALRVLTEFGAATSSDPRLRYDLGFVLAKLLKKADCAVAFEGAYAFAKDHAFAGEAMFELAICYSKLGKHAEEESAYLRALPLADRNSLKAIIHSNLSEARMAQGKVDEGIEAAETAILLAPDMASGQYNLAILKDRGGDAAGALESARHAVELDPENEYLDGDGVFFEPAYERYWYYALRDLALAERELGDARGLLLLAALVDYGKWLEASDPSDRYRKRCEENIARLEKILKLKPQKK